MTNSGVGKSVTNFSIVLEFRASTISLLLTIPPLDRLINLEPFLKNFKDSLLIRSLVSLTRGT